MPASLGAVTEFPYIYSVDAVFSFAVQVLLFLAQTSRGNVMNQGVRDRFSLVERIDLAAGLGVGETTEVPS